MKEKFLISFFLFFFNFTFSQISYPKTIKKTVVDIYHGTKIAEDYRWLEYQSDDSVQTWVKQQNKVSIKFLKKLANSNKSYEQLSKFMFSEMGDYKGKVKYEDKDGYYFNYFVSGNNSTASLYYKKGINSSYNVLVNASALSNRDNVDINYYKVSKNNSLLAYQYNRNGSDWHEIRTVKFDKKRHYQNVLKHTKLTGIYWWNEGFFYKKYPFDSINATYKKPTIMYHEVGKKQSDDKLMFKSYSDDEDINVIGTKDEDFFIIKRENTKSEIFNYYLFNGKLDKTKLNFKPFLINTEYDLSFYSKKDSLLFATTVIRGKKHLISIDKNEPTKFNLVSPSYENHELQHIEMLDDFVIMSYFSLNGSILVKVDYKGTVLNESVLPKGLFVTELNYSKKFDEFFFYLSSYTIPTVLYKLDLKSFKYELVEETGVNFEFKKYKFKQDYYTSHDGVKVPIFIVYKDSLKKNKNTPFLLKTYGGYGSTNVPSYNPGIVYFIENGGAFAYADIRGSGGISESWWKEGKRLKKINGIYDFISAAEYLVNNDYTSPKKIAITGASHGGLIVAAAITKKPNLFGSAVIDVGALDMLRFEKFTIGSALANIQEFGTVNNVTDFENLLSYSPYHNIDESINYPSILLATGNYDNRVPPLHSYKFAAKLQNNPAQKNPILLWTQYKTGHFGANTRKGLLEENTFIYSFLFHQLKSE